MFPKKLAITIMLISIKKTLMLSVTHNKINLPMFRRYNVE